MASVLRWIWEAILRTCHATGLKMSDRTRLVSGGSQDVLTVADLTPELVSNYLRENPEVLEEFVMSHVDVELLERWIIRKTQRSKLRKESDATNGKVARKTSLSRWKFCVHADKRKMLQELTHGLQQKPNKAYVLWELGNCISSAVNADGYNLYLVDKNTQEITHFDRDLHEISSEIPGSQRITAGTTVAAYVARTKETIRVIKPDGDPRFPEGTTVNKEDAKIIMCQPIVQSDGELLGILELFRKSNGMAFHEEDEEIVNSYLVWGGIALHYAEMYHNMVKQRKLNDFLLNVVKSIFQDMVSMDTLIMKIMNFAQKLVNADRASLFLVDNKSKELYARIFDMGVGLEGEAPDISTATEIRFPVGKGIAGQVALTGEVLNIQDAYGDNRFNRTVDQLTGYTTKSILCMPIFIRGNIIGVVQMVNKLYGTFTKADEESFEVFASYCGLALHHAKLYDKIRKSEQKHKVALEMLSYHNTCKEEEMDKIKHTPFPTTPATVDDYYFGAYHLDSDEKTRYSIYMFRDLFGLTRFDLESLIRFTLTVRKNYRRVPYHNWTHGFTVANCVYCIIKHSCKTFTPLESLSLFISCMCHDLDHRGKTNKFMLDTSSPLAAIYTTSTLEHHHFNQTVSILQQDGHNIFKCLSSEEYKTILANIRHCILATDLAVFFSNKKNLQELVNNKAFDWNSAEHRNLLEAITMTACDLCASCKPWDQQVETVRVIFEEFYEQGDVERACGREPIPMMDRTKLDHQSQAQVGFLQDICIPCYQLLYALIPETKPMLDGCMKNLSIWQSLAEEQQARVKAEEMAKIPLPNNR